MTGWRIFGLLTLFIAGASAASPVHAQSARQTAEMTARGCVIRSDVTGRYWACPAGGLRQTDSNRQQSSRPPKQSSRQPGQTQQPDRDNLRSIGPLARSYCVRTCDGYFFPLDGMQNKAEEGRRAACSAGCPGAKTALYSTRPGEEIEDARTTGDSRRYGELEIAFMHREKLVNGCTCRRSNDTSPVEAARNDDTLRRGDIIVTETGMEVYQGPNQFVDYREADSIGRSTREELTRLLNVSQR
ncbi:MAG: DUF2865 domain-containing protein [Salinarimonadaceae bacterium]|nr:MAG: DUF2865 domain-containing protein [Salinarimonadaceae bacterium]